jgi:pimeloyl-ACP methyl ester carboxylesterase
MYTIDVRHKVEDYAQWKAAFDAARDFRREAGEIACRVYIVHGSENDVMVSMDWDSLDRARQFMSSAKLVEGMAEAGVREMPHMVILEKRDEYTP